MARPDLALFFTRFSSHFFAPAAFLLTGITLYHKGAQRSKAQNAGIWISKGIALILIEALINNFLYTFDPYYRTLGLYIIGITGLSMILLAALQYLPLKWITGVSLLVITAHNLLDQVTVSGHSARAVTWYILHQQQYMLNGDRLYTVNYTLLPWAALLALGYSLGHYIINTPKETQRRKAVITGLSLCILFFLLRGINIYGDKTPWSVQGSWPATLISYFNITKYPASLDYICITIGPLLLLFAFTLQPAGGFFTRFFSTLGRMPLLVYLVSTLIIHLAALCTIGLQGFSWQHMIITPASYEPGSALAPYGYSLPAVYGIWLLMLLLQYGICRTITTTRKKQQQQSIQPIAGIS